MQQEVCLHKDQEQEAYLPQCMLTDYLTNVLNPFLGSPNFFNSLTITNLDINITCRIKTLITSKLH
jgi:hypothetical protein